MYILSLEGNRVIYVSYKFMVLLDNDTHTYCRGKNKGSKVTPVAPNNVQVHVVS